MNFITVPSLNNPSNINRTPAIIVATINPLKTSCAFVVCDPTRTRTLLMNRREINKLMGLAQRQGYTLMPLRLYWKGSWAKLEIGIAKGKQEHDKRDSLKVDVSLSSKLYKFRGKLLRIEYDIPPNPIISRIQSS